MTALVRADLAAELCALEARDLEVRARLAADGSLFDGYAAEMEQVHHENAARLRAIVDEVGWPGRALVGAAAASAAWLVVQHAIGDPAFMRAMLPRLLEAARRGDADRAEVAKLEDRILALEGRPQRYGTQYDWEPTLTAMTPINGVEDPGSVDARRAAVGLPPLAWRIPPPPGQPPPADWHARQRELEAWARRAGWRGAPATAEASPPAPARRRGS